MRGGFSAFACCDLASIARDTMIEHMGVGMIVLDKQNRVADVNPAAARNLLEIRAEAVGQDAARALSSAPKLIELGCDLGTRDSQIVLEMTGKWYDARAFAADRCERRLDRAIDHSTRHHRTASSAGSLLEHQGALAMMQERERLAREPARWLGTDARSGTFAGKHRQAIAGTGANAQTNICLDQLAQMTLAAEADMREYLLGAQTVVSADRPFFTALRHYLAL